MSQLGFGFVEIGSVSEQPSVGNRQRPRLWRLERDEALRVFYGCPSDGAAAIAERLQPRRSMVPLGVNLVETNTSRVASAEHAAQELARTVGQFRTLADYLVLNLSCPNMPQGGCSLFDNSKHLGMLLEYCSRHTRLPPLFLKIAPPNGTGPSLRAPTNAAIAAWYERIDRSRHVLIGVGGIASAEDAYETIRLGASLVQLYTAMVYRGPGLIKTINDGLSRLVERDGARSIADIVGVDVRDCASSKKASTIRLVEEGTR